MNSLEVLKSYCNSWSEEDEMEEMMMTMMQFPEFPGGYSNDVVPEQQFPAAPGQFMDATTMAASPSSEKGISMAAMREMIFRIAAMQPIHIDPESVKPPKRRNVKISKDPQSVAARHRRERISEKIRILQRLVPGGTKMDTASCWEDNKDNAKQINTINNSSPLE